MQPKRREEPKADHEAAVDAAIASCGGDLRLTLAELLKDYAALEKRLALTEPVVGFGFTRGWHRGKRG